MVRAVKDFASHLEIPRAVLSSRLRTLVEEQVLARVPGPSGHDEYELTEKGAALLPIIDAMREFGHSWLPCGHDHGG